MTTPSHPRTALLAHRAREADLDTGAGAPLLGTEYLPRELAA